MPDHRADVIPCKDFDQFAGLFETMQQALDSRAREATLIEKWAIIEPVEGDFFIRNGLLAYIAEKSESTQRGGARDHRLRVIFSNGTESDPLMSSFRKSLNDDKTARVIQRLGLGRSTRTGRPIRLRFPVRSTWRAASPKTRQSNRNATSSTRSA
ncbi:hypothetical protein [Rhizobium sp. X9]|uniref:hypothetical protein n=1 Tax=Rhizobium sp. X9 TaxID=2815360 RepID=UPI001C0D68CE|nr:hypothetical protein [Rhizobium sp. X9]